ncbi:MAG: transcriptional repressor LexA [Chromatiales bacterium]|nr:transcriptional repressor LexA [Chromatiales bacterium]
MSDRTNLTARQAQILNLIREYLDDTGMPPTRAEIAAELGFRSANAAEEHLRALERKGVLQIVRGAARGIQLVDHVSADALPVVGRVAAGQPILAEEHIEDYYETLGQVFRPRADYLLRVQGMSMRDAGIMHGDLLAVHRVPEVSSGQIAVVRLDDEVTVKRWRQRGNRVRLLPENPDFEPIEVDLREVDVAIEGLAVGVLRTALR